MYNVHNALVLKYASDACSQCTGKALGSAANSRTILTAGLDSGRMHNQTPTNNSNMLLFTRSNVKCKCIMQNANT